MTTITDLRCEYCVNPLGIESPAPRLSWQLETERRGARQTAFRLAVASHPDLLAADKPDLWDSGRMESDASVLVSYAGKKLRSRQHCWWQVRVRDETGAESVSTTAHWEMGLLNAGDWKAQWITATTPVKHHDLRASPMLRKVFHLRKPVANARAYVCGLGFHEFFLNGRKVGDAVLHPSFTKYDARVLYTVHDISAYLRAGDNCAGLMTGTGWYNHHAQDSWNLCTAPWRDECKALIQVEIAFEDGSRTIVASDATWLGSAGPIVFDGLRNGEIYDAREERPGWNKPDYDPAGWQNASIARHPGGVLHAQLMPPCRALETIRPLSLKEARPGVFIYDLGQNIAGWARLTISGPAGTTVVMRYAEKLAPDGDLDQSNLCAHVKSPAPFQADTYILKGNGIETYEPRFAYHGFQYVAVTGLPAPATLDMLSGVVVHTDLEKSGSFECSNDLINSIQQAAAAATLSNYHGMPTDCPHREKNGWTGDAQLSAEQVLFNFDPAAAYTKWMDDFVDCQRPSGALPGIVPTGGWGYNWGAGPAWDSTYILIPWYLYLYKGDTGILRRHYDGMKRYLGFLDSLATDYIVHFGLGDWCPPAQGPESHKAPAELTNTAYYYADTVLLARIALLLGKRADARRFTALSRKIKASARRHFYNQTTRRIVGHGQTAIACFLYQGLCEPAETEQFGAMLAAEVAACRDHIDCGILGAKYLLNTMTELGQADKAFRIVTQTDYPGWGLWIKQGATTLWETWDGNASRNHHMFSDVSAWFYKALAGIQPDPEQPGFKHIIIKPWPVPSLAWVKAETRTPYGRVRSAWRKDNNRLTLELSIPPNSSASLYLPARDDREILEGGLPFKKIKDLSFRGLENDRALFSINAGNYCFEAQLPEEFQEQKSSIPKR